MPGRCARWRGGCAVSRRRSRRRRAARTAAGDARSPTWAIAYRASARADPHVRSAHAPGRFTAAVRSAGGGFLTGAATFTSGPLTVRTGLSCRSGGRLRPFTRLTYRGTLDPSSRPLLAAFDTLPLPLREGTPATYIVREYGRDQRRPTAFWGTFPRLGVH